MKKTSIAILILMIGINSNLLAEGTDLSFKLNLIPKIGIALPEHQLYQTVDIEFNVMIGEIFGTEVFGVGAELGWEYGYLFGDSYITAISLIRFFWLYVGIGYSFKITEAKLPPNSTYTSIDYVSPNDNFPALKLGLSIPMLHVGQGKLGLNIFAVMHSMDEPKKPSSGWLNLPTIMPAFEVMYSIPLKGN